MAEPTGSQADQPDLEELLEMLKQTRGIDFTGYKRSTLGRRIGRRMSATGRETLAEYRDYLEVQPEEYGLLFDSLLINVTAFFRDQPAWDALRSEVLPKLLGSKPPTVPIRVWSAGCATGEEAFTLAMVLAEELGVEAFRDRVKIYATDLDESALQVARTGTYEERRLADLPPDLLDKYFEPGEGVRTFRRDLRRQVIFGRNDLTCDAPISRVDLLVIRNTLMYFNAETQAAILRRLHFALADPGYIFLGKAEMLLNHGELFDPIDLRKRLFRKIPRSLRPGAVRRTVIGQFADDHGVLSSRLRAATLAAGPVAQLALNTEDQLVVANSRAEALFNLHPMDIGRPFQDLEVSYRPVELRSVIEQVKTDLRPVELEGVGWQRASGAETSLFDISIIPLFGNDNAQIGIGISFTDVTRYSRLREELEHANEKLERAYQELQSLNEELETTNEELQSTNEELETTNEELQSTNEELETMNEELQSTNDELQEINDALRVRTEELDQTNAFLASVLQSLGNAVIVVDRDLRVTIWSPGAQDLWGVRQDEAQGHSLEDLDIGLPVSRIAPMIRGLLRDSASARSAVELDAVNRRGRPVRLEVELSVLHDDGGQVSGVILVTTLTGNPGG
ncbi:PAS domain-containing protein [Actinoallomurus sp. NBC_01490]|uniref:CheR family methyltransferase n=1 Tax=Actinoallomurus sp. NBC_01490 TaxID=2903557 RepID=UPI002E3444F7|nr:CheR family methyltransferase [Actinoallomurus sp. NBC_01490]